MMAFPEPPAFYPVISMPKVFSPIPGNVCPPPRMYVPPPSPPQSFNSLHMPSPFGRPPMPFPPPNRFNTPPTPQLRGPPSPPFNMSSPPMSFPPKFLPPPPPNMQRPLTPPPSAPSSPRPPVLGLNSQNDILTQRWQWLPSMLCSIVNDPTGAIYKIMSINWDGRSKEFYLQKYATEGESLPEDDKDVPECDLILPTRPQETPCELTPPASERQWSPAPSDLGSDRGAPIRGANFDGGRAPMEYGGDDRDSEFSRPRPAYVEDCRDDRDDDFDDDYDSKPSLSPAMADRGVFPADEAYYSSRNQSYDGDYFGDEDEYSGRDDDGYGQDPRGFVPLRPQESQAFVNLRAPEHQEFVTIRRPDNNDKRHETPVSHSERSERSERSGRSEKRSHSGSQGKKKRSHKEKSGEKEREGEKSKSKSKNRSRRSSTSSKKDDKKDERKEEKKESSHRSGRTTRKPSIWTLPKF